MTAKTEIDNMPEAGRVPSICELTCRNCGDGLRFDQRQCSTCGDFSPRYWEREFDPRRRVAVKSIG